MSYINFYDLKIISSLKKKKVLKKFLWNLFINEGKVLQHIDFIFCTDKYLLNLNKRFLNHNYYTDTITFSISKKPLMGEVYISIPRVKKNASKFKVSYQDELTRVIIHSCLHLCGFNDKKNKEALKMENLQEKYLNKWFVSRETQIGG